MQKDEGLTMLRQGMLLINLTACVFLGGVFILTPLRAAQRAEGISFLQGLSSLPAAPWSVTIAVVGLIAFVAIDLAHRLGKRRIGRAACWLEPLCALAVILTLHLDYNGLLLLAVVNLVNDLRGRVQLLFLGTMTSLYL